MFVVESIMAFAKAHPNPLIDLYLSQAGPMSLETQVNVKNGERVEGMPPSVRRDDEHIYWPIRVPKHAHTDPVLIDYDLDWPMAEYAVGIGTTWWNFKERTTPRLMFDIDRLLGHKNGLSDADYERICRLTEGVPWLEHRNSKTLGRHLYANLSKSLETENHGQHGQLARVIQDCLIAPAINMKPEELSKLIDVGGGNDWIWHADQVDGAYELVQTGEVLHIEDIPADWRNYKRPKSKRKVTVQGVDFDHRTVELTDEQKQHIEDAAEWASEWDADLGLWRTHTKFLAEYTEAGHAKGLFATDSPGSEPGEANCFCYPQPDGSWAVYRFTPGESEHRSWKQDGEGYTRADFNRPTTPETAAAFFGGVYDHDDGSWWFQSIADAVKMHEAVSGEAVPIPEWMDREATVHIAKDRTGIVTTVERITQTRDRDGDAYPDDWRPKGKNKWQYHSACTATQSTLKADAARERICLVYGEPPEVGESKELGHWIRDTEDPDNPWWQHTTRRTLESRLTHELGSSKAAKALIGEIDSNPYYLSFDPFQPEVQGRTINIAAQLKYAPVKGEHPYHDLVIRHIYQSLEGCLTSDWCREHTPTPYRYGLTRIAYMFQKPEVRLAYTGLVGCESGGKGTFVNMLENLMRGGKCNADKTLANNDKFDGHLAGKVVVRIEEANVATKSASERIKTWVTEPFLNLRDLYKAEKRGPNYSAIFQLTNEYGGLPVFGEATRFLILDIPKPDPLPAGIDLEAELEKEGPAFTHTVLNFELPPPDPTSRFAMPVPDTTAKRQARDTVANDLEAFLAETVQHIKGPEEFSIDHAIKFSEFRKQFNEWQLAQGHDKWSMGQIKDHLPVKFGYRSGTGNNMYVYHAQWLAGAHSDASKLLAA